MVAGWADGVTRFTFSLLHDRTHYGKVVLRRAGRTGPREAEMAASEYGIGQAYNLQVGRTKHFAQIQKMIHWLSDPVFDAQSKTWTATCLSIHDQSTLSQLADGYQVTITAAAGDDERTALIRELRDMRARRAEIMRILGALTEDEKAEAGA